MCRIGMALPDRWWVVERRTAGQRLMRAVGEGAVVVQGVLSRPFVPFRRCGGKGYNIRFLQNVASGTAEEVELPRCARPNDLHGA